MRRHHHHHHHHDPLGGDEGRRGPPFGRGGRRGGRMFEQGDLRWVVLRLVSDQPRHGYELIKAIEDLVGGGYSPSPGVIYPTLTLLEELGYVSVAPAEGGRKLFTITEVGTEQLAAHRASVEALFERMAGIRQRRAGAYPPPLARALENLSAAIRLKVEAAPLSDDQVRAVAEVLDAAALAVERA
jgi:DNA-binding PadR family transcriptional regulator